MGVFLLALVLLVAPRFNVCEVDREPVYLDADWSPIR